MSPITHTKLVLLVVLFSVTFHSARASGYWTWITGTTDYNPSPVVVHPGFPSTENSPGATLASIMWIHEDTLYVMGGTDGYYILNALWKFNITAKTWFWETWPNDQGHYGTRVLFTNFAFYSVFLVFVHCSC
jgi:hypothetical protein